MRILRFLYTAYGVVIFFLLFAILLPILLIPVCIPSQHHLVGVCNRWWARLMLFFIAIPYKLSYEEKLDKHKQYIFCANHFSYMDIASTALNHHNTIFVGKSEVARVPIFGFMYRKLHITVDRSKLKSRYSTLLKTKQALDEGKSLVIFPEGGIITKGGPSMGTFKDGAFRVSIEKQIPIVPVTIPFNWIILPPDVFLLKWKPMKAVFHKPIDPSKYTINDIAKYRELVRSIIQEELTRQLQHEN